MMQLSDEHRTKLIEWIQGGQQHIRVTQAPGAARAYFLASLFQELVRPCMVVLPTAKDAARFSRELEFFLPESSTQGAPGERRLYDFPPTISPRSQA